MRRLAVLALFALIGTLAWVLVLHPMLSSAGGKALSPAEIKLVVDAPTLNSYSASGTTTSLYKGKPLSLKMKALHSKPNKHRIEYLSEPLKGVVIIDNGSQVWRCDPKLHSAVSMDSNQDRQMELFLQNHRVERVGGERIAGRSASELLVKSKSGQLKKRLWVDAKTNVILRSEDYDASGKAQSSMRLDSIKYAPVSDSLFARPSNGVRCLEGPGKAMGREELTKAIGFAVKPPRYIPKGYRLEGYRLYDCPCGCGHKSAYIRYTNGLESISIFETRADSGCLKEGKCGAHVGKRFVCDNLALTSKNGISFVVIADLKSVELRKITDSIK